ncbi:YtxH domain-containing protein [Stackebrandtia soli]|uniref:YtxH domain-containing protein n=1 Tax=Stackebrandtia soli TaxID=1892856 RepID=UPI0039ED367A
MGKVIFAAGVAVGYVLGARAGRERYEQIAKAGRTVRDSSIVRNITEIAQEQAKRLAESCREKLKQTHMGERFLGDSRADQFPPANPRPEHWETAGIGPSRNGHGHNGTQGF